MKSIGQHSFNVTASDLVPVGRALPDARPQACHEISYDITTFPNVSIIVIFHNEARSTLLRTIHSIIDRSGVHGGVEGGGVVVVQLCINKCNFLYLIFVGEYVLPFTK